MLETAILPGVLLLLCLIAVVLLAIAFLRWHSFNRDKSTFSCSFHVGSGVDGGRWSRGIAKFSGGALLWYSGVGFTRRPDHRFLQREIELGPKRWPEGSERALLLDDQQIVLIQDRNSLPLCELAMESTAMTGLLAWIEAAPPGEGQYGITQR
jgi:hypothetical protein